VSVSSSRVEVDIKPAVLIWARESIGLSREEAANQLDMTETALGMLEVGAGDVSMARLRRMAEVYDRPLLAFFLPERPDEQDSLPDFRMTPENRGKPWSPKLHEAYRRVAGQREVLLDLSERSGEPIEEVGLLLSLTEDAEAAAARVPAWLSPPAQFDMSTEGAILNQWSSMIEARGVLVTQVSGVDVDEMRGFSIGEHPLPAIALNGADTLRGRLFTLLHELVHILLHRSALRPFSSQVCPRARARTVGIILQRSGGSDPHAAAGTDGRAHRRAGPLASPLE
jgi:transcriptional regulator with XRE-family HTH domain